MFNKDKVQVYPVETWHYHDNSGMPPTLIYYSPKLPPNDCVYWTQDGPDMKGFKAGVLYDAISDEEKL
jgi:hypothetical protein